VTAVLRVLIADLPDLQADVLAILVGAETDMLVVGRGVGPHRLGGSAEDLMADVIVMPRLLGGCDSDALLFLAERPNVGVIALDETSGTIAQVALVRGDETWPARVITAIRTAAPQHVARHRL